MDDEAIAEFLGTIQIESIIQADTGIFIGGTDTGISIGGADQTVIRSGLNNEPILPGSSLRGSMRSLLDQINSNSLNHSVKPGDKRTDEVKLHQCETREEFDDCFVCQTFGVLGDDDLMPEPTRFIVSDAALTESSRERLENHPNLDMPMTEVKTEVAIDRLTSNAVPRKRERVPADTEFDWSATLQLYNTPRQNDMDEVQTFLKLVIRGLRLLEETYLGGQGSRGYGRITFSNLSLEGTMYSEDTEFPDDVKSLFNQNLDSATTLDKKLENE